MKLTAYDRPIGVSLETPKPKAPSRAGVSVINNPAYRDDLKSGRLAREIADKWGIVTGTVHQHRSNLRRKGEL